ENGRALQEARAGAQCRRTRLQQMPACRTAFVARTGFHVVLPDWPRSVRGGHDGHAAASVASRKRYDRGVQTASGFLLIDPTVPVVETHDIVQFRRRDLEDVAVF